MFVFGRELSILKVPIDIGDAAWFFIEKSDAPSHFGPLLILSRPKNASKNYVSDLVARWRSYDHDIKPPFNYKLSLKPRPKWLVLPDNKIDLEYHFRHAALPAPGGEKELGELISRLHSHRLDRSKPLWECYLIEGLENNRFAIYLKLHHGQMDGMASVGLMQRTFSTNARKRNMLPPWAVGLKVLPEFKPTSVEPSETKTLTKNEKDLVPRKSILSASKSLLKKSKQFSKQTSLHMAKAYSGLYPEVGAPFKAPKTMLNGRISGSRRYATQRFALARLTKIAKAADVSLNDVFLSICGGALRRYITEYETLPVRSLIGQVPVNIRRKSDTGMGNALAFIFVSLGTNIEDPVKRLEIVHKSTEAGKTLNKNIPPEGIQPLSMLMMGPYLSQVVFGLAGHVPPAANLVISNIRGSNKRLYFNGAKIDQIYGPSVLFHGQALNITMSTYVDELNIGFTGCRKSLPSMQKIAVYTGEALTVLETAMGIVEK
ncbi:MAG: wax ester/triacylglycerol synthase family O-acyltransferase [Robiginitomaculum sp.]|nr:MAG: wax ester/triacylglycerol synthase family O-acyltransferase [Robiginitomaculum sp.]